MIYMYIYINTYTFICHNSTPYKDLGLTEKNTELMPLAKKEKKSGSLHTHIDSLYVCDKTNYVILCDVNILYTV